MKQGGGGGGLEQLRLLIAVAEGGSLARAARSLHLSQSTISMQIRQLEEMLGVRLLERHGRNGSVLSPEGELACSYGREMLRQWRMLEGALERMRRGARGELSVAASHTTYIYILPRLLRDFHARYPEIHLSCLAGTVSQVQEAVVRGKAEVGFIWGRAGRGAAPLSSAGTAGGRAEPLWDEPFFIVARWDHPLADREEVAPADLGAYPFIIGPRDNYTRHELEQELQRVGVDLRCPVEFETPAACKEAILAGAGIGMLAASAAADELDEGRIRRLPVSGFEITHRLYLIDCSGGRLSPVASTFREFILRSVPQMARGKRRLAAPDKATAS